MEEKADGAERSGLQFRADQIVDVLNEELKVPLEVVFTQEFLADVSPAQITALSKQFTSLYGRAIAVQDIRPASASQAQFDVRMQRAIAKGILVIDPEDGDKIDGLRFTDFQQVDDSAQKIEQSISDLPGEVSAYFAPLSGGEAIVAIGDEAQMPIGSTIKLYVLAALAQEIKAGSRKWDDVVPLSEASLPSGMLQDWPQGAPITLASLASLMISISDNTATDQLIAELGRERVLKAMIDSGHAMPDMNDPIITTRDLFQLKGGDTDRLETFAKGNAELRAQILDTVKDEPLDPEGIAAAFAKGPIALEVEWFASGKDLAKLFQFMRQTSDPKAFEIMAIDPNLPPSSRKDWAYSGYKGGSEPGVLNLTWLLTDASGDDHILWLSWRNDEANLDTAQLESLAQRILNLSR
ncbi:MAG: serine hydrolase [Erythrobacter sp.]